MGKNIWIQGVLWDMDGVLIDTYMFHFRSWSEALAEHDLLISGQQFRSTFGMNNAATLRTLFGEKLELNLVTEIGDRKEELFRQAIKGKAELLPGVRQWLDRLREWGVKQAIASSAPQANIEALVHELKLEVYFSAIVAGANLPAKPDPAVFLEAVRRIEVPPEQCVVVEDAVSGVQAALQAGCRCIAVTTTNTAGDLEAADWIVDRLDQLPKEVFLA